MQKKLALLLMFAANLANAIVIGDSNLGIFGYPDPKCTKPMRPIRPYSFSNKYELDSYNSQVASFNIEMDDYTRCVRQYLDAANNDIEEIKEKMNKAINRAKASF